MSLLTACSLVRLQRNAAGEIGLQPTPLATEMTDLIRDHLQATGSWPCFLAAATLKLAAAKQG